jgi:multiple sugar transport system ATP-binding protein
MGRAIVRDPSVFLMDEPLSNLDAKLRVQMRSEISRIQRSLDATTIYVTHDQVEAMTMGDRVCVLRKGLLQQEGSPDTLYDQPANLFVASFIGSPAMNLVQARLERGGAGLEAVIGEQRLPVPAVVTAARPGLEAYVGRELALGIRPEDLEDAALADGGGRLRGQVLITEALGSDRMAHVAIDAQPVLSGDVLEVAGDVDASAVEELRSEAAARRVTLVGRLSPRSQVRMDQTAELAVDTERLYFFDLESGLAV